MITISDTLSPELLQKMDAYWRAANYLTVGQIYVKDNSLLEAPFQLEHLKPRLLGHCGTTTGLNFIYVHLNRPIKQNDREMIYITGPGHGGPGGVRDKSISVRSRGLDHCADLRRWARNAGWCGRWRLRASRGAAAAAGGRHPDHRDGAARGLDRRSAADRGHHWTPCGYQRAHHRRPTAGGSRRGGGVWVLAYRISALPGMLPEINPYPLAIATGVMTATLLAGRVAPYIPGALLAVVASALAVTGFHL